MRPIYALGLFVIGVALVVAPATVFYFLVHGRIGPPDWLPTGPRLIWSCVASEVVGFVFILLSRNFDQE